MKVKDVIVYDSIKKLLTTDMFAMYLLVTVAFLHAAKTNRIMGIPG